MNISKEEYEDI